MTGARPFADTASGLVRAGWRWLPEGAGTLHTAWPARWLTVLRDSGITEQPRILAGPEGQELLLARCRIAPGLWALRWLGWQILDHPVAPGITLPPIQAWPALAREIGCDLVDLTELPTFRAISRPAFGPGTADDPPPDAWCTSSPHWMLRVADWSPGPVLRRKLGQMDRRGRSAGTFQLERQNGWHDLDRLAVWKRATLGKKEAERFTRLVVPMLQAPDAWPDTEGRTAVTWRLMLNGIPVALLLSWIVVESGRLDYLMPGYDPAWGRLMPGHRLLADLMRQADAHGLQQIDFLRGDQDYKRLWATGSTPYLRLRCGATPLGRAALLTALTVKRWTSGRR